MNQFATDQTNPANYSTAQMSDFAVKKSFVLHDGQDARSKLFYYDHVQDILWKAQSTWGRETGGRIPNNYFQQAVAVYTCRFHNMQPANVPFSDAITFTALTQKSLRLLSLEHAALCPLTKRLIVVRRSWNTIPNPKDRRGRVLTYHYRADLHELFQIAGQQIPPIPIQVSEYPTPDSQRIMNL